MEYEVENLANVSPSKRLTAIAAVAALTAAAIYFDPFGGLASSLNSAKAGISNISALEADVPKGDFGAQTLYYIPSVKMIDMAPVQVDSLKECFDTAQAEMRRLIAEGNNETFFGPRCKDEDTGKVVVIGN